MNKVILIGNLGKDPKIIFDKNGDKLAKFSVATTDTWINKQTGETGKNTEWHEITFFGSTAGVVEKYLFKGSKVCVEGRIKTSTWADKGTQRVTKGIIGEKLEMLGENKNEPRVETKSTIHCIPPPSYGFSDLSEIAEDDVPF